MPSRGKLLSLVLALISLSEAWGGVRISRTPEGKLVYRRDPKDRAFNTRGIGTPPRGMDPFFWYVYDPYIQEFAEEEGVDPVLVKAVIYAESRFQWKATSPRNARGLMQLIDATGRRFGAGENPYDPIANIRGGVRYLAYLQTRFSGNLFKIVAAYNAGERAVEKHGGVPPYKETQAYVPAVLAVWDQIHLGG